MSGKSELFLFDEPSPQIVVESGRFIDIQPQSSLSESGTCIEFVIHGSDTEYLDLNDTLLYIKLKVTASDGKALVEASKVCPANYLMNALFSDVTLSLNDKVIEGGNQVYAYKSTIEDIFGFNRETRDIQLRAKGYIEDENVRMGQLISKSKVCELGGAMRLDFFNQPKYLLPGVTVRVRMQRSKDTFAMIHGAGSPKIQILGACLYVRRVRVSPSVIKGHEMGLAKKNAIYSYTRGQVISYSVAQGSHSHFRDNIFSSSLLPKFVVVGMVKSEAFNGDTVESNPFQFEHFDVQSVGLYRDGQSVPYNQVYEPNFTENLYVREYVKSIIHGPQHLNTNLNNGIRLKDFGDGKYCLFTFNLTPDFDNKDPQVARDGNLRLELKFRTALAKAINVIVYGVFDTQLQVTKQRDIIHVH